MAELRLEFHLPDFLLPEGWVNEEEEQEGEGAGKLPSPEAEQGSLLGAEDTLSSFSLCTSMDFSSCEPFPCLADELEQQAKALEREWYCPTQPLAGAPSPRRSRAVTLLLASPGAAPALRHSGLDVHQQQVVKEEELGAVPASSIPPTTPTKRSQGHNSSWNESQCAVSDPQEVQSPARPMALLPEPPQPQHSAAPITLAVDNAESVCLGRQPVCPAAWRGCNKDPWCNRELRHRGPCNHRATVPGLLAYSRRQLFDLGVNVEELCRAPELVHGSGAVMEDHPAPAATRAAPGISAEGSLPTKRRANVEADPCTNMHSYPYPYPYTAQLVHQQREQQAAAALGGEQQEAAAAASCPTSSGSPPQACPDTLSGHSQQGSRAEEPSSSSQGGQREHLQAQCFKRARLSEELLHAEAAEVAAAVAASSGDDSAEQDALSSDDHKSGVTGSRQTSMTRQPSTHNMHLLQQQDLSPAEAVIPVVEDVPSPAAAVRDAAAPALPHSASAARTGLRSKAGGRYGGRGVVRPFPTASAAGPAGGQEPVSTEGKAPMQLLPPTSRIAKAAATPSKPHARQLPKTPDTANTGVRTNQRRVILHWNNEQVTDPRSGKVVFHVDPATFCTQCFVTHTPVWRAGPFGHKTLCNACGVRYMKYAKNKK